VAGLLSVAVMSLANWFVLPVVARCLSLPHFRPGIHTVKANLQSRPILAQHAALLFAFGGKLVIVALKKGCLAVPDQEKAAHSELKGRMPRISRTLLPCE